MKIVKVQNQELEPRESEFLNLIQNTSANLKGWEILREAFSKINPLENIHAHAFLNGKSIENFEPASLENLEKSLNEIEYSIRIANIQKTSPIVQELCNRIYQELGFAATCNLYFTPSSQTNCFDYHVDMQESIVLQLLGEKTWSFPQDDNLKFQTIPIGTIPSPFIVKIQKKVILQKDDLLYVGRNIIHKAENRDKMPSIHLTFALQKMNAVGFVFMLTQEIEKKLDLNHLINIYPDKEECMEIIRLYLKKIAEVDPEALFHLFEEESKNRELKLLKRGRSY
jgi:ribosomal protein L16 Arg81 hydroxylase